jgi:hypothetical protein
MEYASAVQYIEAEPLLMTTNWYASSAGQANS